jgi:imidazolonepropionase-like amidohydrolase
MVGSAVLALASACAPPAPDLVLLNGRVFTADRDRPWAEALAIRGGRVVGVGTSADIADLASGSTLRRDLGGHTVVPGFNDAHVADAERDSPAIAALAEAAVASGITSMHWFVGGRLVREAVEALTAADAPLRIRVLRMPRPEATGETLDSRPHLPPQPTRRIDVRGMGFVLGFTEAERIRQAVGWAYGSEDPLAIEATDTGALVTVVHAVEHTGPAEVWARKRPRIERPGPAATPLAARLKAAGIVVVQRPGDAAPLRSLLDEGVHLALASGRGERPFDLLAWATSPDRGPEQLTMAQAITAFTRGSAYAEFADRDKGHLTTGAVADLAVLSDDPFTASPEHLRGARSILTMIAGRVVHDVP